MIEIGILESILLQQGVIGRKMKMISVSLVVRIEKITNQINTIKFLENYL